MDYNKALLDFIGRSPTAFHAVHNLAETLTAHGYTRLYENDNWKLEPSHGYFVTRNDSALLAFYIPQNGCRGFQIMASHSDSPAFKLKSHAEIEVANEYIKLNIEKYGGMIVSTWFDRPLSVAGRLIVRTADGIAATLVDIDRDLLMIPSLAIHMNRGANDGAKLGIQKELLPLFAQKETEQADILALAAQQAGVRREDILDADLFLYNRMKGTVYGAEGEFIASGRLDDLQCAFASVQGLLEAEVTERVAVCCIYDNEEVGSGTRQGAASTFLKDVLARIQEKFARNEEQCQQTIADSFMLSADNAHSAHPNYMEKADPVNRPYMNRGIVIKYSANQKYTTDALSGGICRLLCDRAEVPYQLFYNHSDVLGGSTLGNISTAQLPLCAADIGLAQLAMHSAYETAGAKDTEYLVRLAKTLFSTGISTEHGQVSIR